MCVIRTFRPRVVSASLGRNGRAVNFPAFLQRISDFRPRAFPQFFPQLWKTSGGDPTEDQRTTNVSIAFSTLAIDTSAAGSLVFMFLRSTSSAAEVSKSWRRANVH